MFPSDTCNNYHFVTPAQNSLSFICHSGLDPESSVNSRPKNTNSWIPAFAGMTFLEVAFSFLIAKNLDDKISFSPPVIEIDENDLLPCSQRQFPLDQGNGEGWFH